MSNSHYMHLLPRYHSCHTEYKKRHVHVSVTGFDWPNYEVDYCPKCEVYVFDGGRGIQSPNKKDLAAFIGNLVLEGRTRKGRKIFIK